jgi:hypothetical protein
MKIRDNILPVLGPKGGEEEVQAIREVIESGWWGKGPKVAQFEEQFAEMVGQRIWRLKDGGKSCLFRQTSLHQLSQKQHKCLYIGYYFFTNHYRRSDSTSIKNIQWT